MAIVLGVLAAGIPMVVLNLWLKTQGNDEVSATAAQAVAAAEVQIVYATAALQGLSARGTDTCRPAHLDAMRQAVMSTAPIKEVMVVASNDQIMCTDSGALVGRYRVVSSAASGNGDVKLDVMQVSDQSERFLRVRRISRGGKPSLGALVPASALLPRASIQGGKLAGHVSMVMADGTLIGETGSTPGGPGAKNADFRRSIKSQPYGFSVALALTNNGVIANHDDLRRVGMVVSGLVALVILIFALIFPWRHANNPIADIARAIMADEFVPYYQPIVDIKTGRLLGAEVLVRWRRPDGNYVEPRTFVSLMESTGLVLELTRSMMRRVRADLSEAVGRRPAMTIAFNVAPQHFDDALILNDVGTIFDGSPIKLSQIVLELTERYEVENLTKTRRTIAALQGLGCKVAIDNVGTGHGGVSYILKLGVDMIKIDKVFVESISNGGRSSAMIETLIDLANNMRMDIIAEGVETFDQVTCLRERGIGAAQGYVFAPPLPAGSFLQLLEAMDPATATAGQAQAKPATDAAKIKSATAKVRLASNAGRPAAKPAPVSAVSGAGDGKSAAVA